MKPFFTTILWLCFFNLSFCQQQNFDINYLTSSQSTDSLRKYYDKLNSILANQQLTYSTSNGINNYQPDVTSFPKILKAELLSKKLKTLINKNTSKGNLPLYFQNKVNLCSDTSYSRLINFQNSTIYISAVTSTSDGNILVPAVLFDSSTVPNQFWKGFAVLFKLNESGDIVWVKKFEDLTVSKITNFSMQRAYELPNQDIICTATLDTGGVSKPNAMIYRLNSNGNLIWKSGLKSNLIDPSTPNAKYCFYANSAIEGLNGDVVLCGTSSNNGSGNNIATVIRFNNIGQKVWDANYGNYLEFGRGVYGTNVTLRNSQILLTSLSLSSGSLPSIGISKLDYSTGNTIDKRFFTTNYADPWENLYKSFSTLDTKSRVLSNNHILFFGKLNSNLQNLPATKSHFGIVEFDTSFNIVNKYIISSDESTNISANCLEFDSTGRGLIALSNFIASYQAYVYFGTFKNKQFQSLRKMYYQNVGMSGRNGLAFLNDGGYAYVQTYFENNTIVKNYVEFRKMHDSDTSSSCLGTDTTFINFLPFNVINYPAYPFFGNNMANEISILSQNVNQTSNIPTRINNLCGQSNFCDTIKIHGNPVICSGGPPVVFTSYKNNACGAIVQWDIDNAVIDSIKTLTDTSVRIWFKNINWQGMLYASIGAGTCYSAVKDSTLLNLSGAQLLNLGPDTSICIGNSIVLNARRGFATYKWQDGSTDSVFTVTTPGIYYVDVNDACGNTLSDTVHVSLFNYPFFIGNDTLRCNKDTITLTATQDLTNYQWQPNYNINNITQSIVKVYPAIDTFYYATAQVRPGCIVKDTVHITVKSSPPIQLGADTSLCIGNSLILDAGSGFANYQWNTGDVTQQITVGAVGNYVIKATAANTCVSTDTLAILNVSPLPNFTLGIDTTLCAGITYKYAFNLPNATYLWQGGNTNGNYTINTAGEYWLAVTQLGCTARDTVKIFYKDAPIVQIGVDSNLCKDNSYLLNAFYPTATYSWQDGSTTPTFLVTQPGLYYVTNTLSNNCTFKDSVFITYTNKPIFTLGADTGVCITRPIILTPSVNVEGSYLWQDGSTLKSYQIKRSGIYNLTVFNKCGTHTDDIIISESSCELLIPNSFTPNGDGLNDVFKIKYPFKVLEFTFSIYNKYGTKIYETNDMLKGWDGTYKSKKQEIGSYVWVIKLKNLNGYSEALNGMVTLLR
jgi:gliding motility-associated-like protein